MNMIKKYIQVLTSQLKQSNVKLPIEDVPHKITDDNQSIHNGVIHEKPTINLRSQSTISTRG
jgi:hypothetical protein